MKRINYDEPIKNLPDAFLKDKDSNNYKLLQIHKEGNDKVLNTLREMSDALNIDNAYGNTLDLWYGEKVVLKRGQMTDEQYLIRLKGKLMQNMADGSFPKMIKALAFVLQCNTSDIHIVESENTNGVIIKDMPISMLQKAGFTIYQINDLVNQLLSVGVYVLEFSYEKKSELSLYIGGFATLSTKHQTAQLKITDDSVMHLSQLIGGVAGCITKYQTIGVQEHSKSENSRILAYTGGFATNEVKHQTAQIKTPQIDIFKVNQCSGGFAAGIVKHQTITI